MLANGSAFALSSCVWTGNRARGRRIAARLSGGSCAVNDVIRVIANPHAAFGGNRSSGYGRYHGPHGLHAFSRIRTIMLADDRSPREINWFPFTSRTRRQLAGLLRFRHGGTGFIARLNRLLMLIPLASVLCAPVRTQSKAQSHLIVNVLLDRDAHGELGYLIFDSPAGFPGDPEKAIRHGFLPIPAGARQMQTQTDLPPGTYAVSVYEDRNSNHKLDRNLLGIPREPVGVSNNPRPRMGPPRFADSSFHIGAVPQIITIALVRTS